MSKPLELSCPYCLNEHVTCYEKCRAVFSELPLNFGLPLTLGIGRAFVDTYCLQHPEILCVSAKSYAVHLSLVHCWVVHGNRKEVHEALRRGYNGPFIADKPFVPEPRQRGKLTVAYLQQATGKTDFEKRIAEWTADVWEAYSDLHTQAKAYFDYFVAGQASRPI